MGSGLYLARFRCSGCGDCCRSHRVPLTAADLSRLVAATGAAPERLVEWATSNELDMSGEPSSLARLPAGPSVLLLATRAGACALLSDDQRCSVHSARPMACRLYPFSPTLGRKGGVRRLRVLRGSVCDIVLDAPSSLATLARDYARLKHELSEHHRQLAGWNRRQERRRRLGRALLGPSELLSFLLVAQTAPEPHAAESSARAAGHASSG